MANPRCDHGHRHAGKVHQRRARVAGSVQLDVTNSRRLDHVCAITRSSQVPNRYETADGYPLGSWLNTVRGRGVKGSLEPERTKQLEALPAWTWTPKADSWDRACDLLL
jgi:hypothetical protein